MIKTSPFYLCLKIILISAYLIFFVLPFLQSDLFVDELYSLDYFTLCTPINTITDYHIPNNHILFNLINNYYLQALGIVEIGILIEHPYIIRIIPFLITLLTGLLIYNFLKNEFGPLSAKIGIMMFMTTVPILNYSCAIRGYSLSCLLVLSSVILVYKLSQNSSFKLHVSLITLVALALYVIPSNLYCIISLGLFSLFSIFYQRQERSVSFFSANKRFIYLGLSLSIGIFLGIILYAPVLQSVLGNEYVSSKSIDIFKLLRIQTDDIFKGLVSGRWVIALASCIGFSMLWSTTFKAKLLLAISVFLFIVPLLLNYLQLGEAPPRVFFVNLPIYLLVLSIGLAGFVERFARAYSNNFKLGLVVAYLIPTLISQQLKIGEKLEANAFAGIMEESTYFQFFNHQGFFPSKAMKEVEDYINRENLPLFMDDYDQTGMPYYTSHYGIPTLEMSDFESFLELGRPVFVMTNNILKFADRDNLQVDIMSKKANWNTILKVSSLDTAQLLTSRSLNAMELKVDFENEKLRDEILIDTTIGFKSASSQKLNAVHPYSFNFRFPFYKILDNRKLKVQVECFFTQNPQGSLVVEVTRNKKNLFWRAFDLKSTEGSEDDWVRFSQTVAFEGDFLPQDRVKIFIWNPELKEFNIDNFTVSSIDDENEEEYLVENSQ